VGPGTFQQCKDRVVSRKTKVLVVGIWVGLHWEVHSVVRERVRIIIHRGVDPDESAGPENDVIGDFSTALQVVQNTT